MPWQTRLFLAGNTVSKAGFGQSLAFIVSPAIATGLIAAGAPGVWIGLLCLGCLGTVAVGAVLRRTLTVEQDRVQPGANGSGQAVGPLPSQPRRLNIVSNKTIATSSVPMPRNRK